MRLRPRLSLAGALSAMLAVSCTNPGWVCGCSPLPPGAVLYSRVTDGAGAGVAGATVTAQMAGPGCIPPVRSLHDGAITSGADGAYRTRIYAHQYPRPGDCLRAFATAPEGSALQNSDTVPFAVHLSTGNEVDSARVDLVLRAP